jgi:Fe(3+) dicitrate transport protein
VGGAELSVGQEVALSKRLKLRIDATYTLTMSQFLSTFSSPNPLFGDVEAGDSLPYVPEHQGAVTSAVSWGRLDLGLIVGLTSAMRDVPGQGPLDPLAQTDGRGIVDAVASWRLFDNVTLSVRGDNLLNDQALTSLRPFGARPSKPLTFAAGLKVEL